MLVYGNYYQTTYIRFIDICGHEGHEIKHDGTTKSINLAYFNLLQQLRYIANNKLLKHENTPLAQLLENCL